MYICVVWADDNWLAEHAGSTAADKIKEKGDDEPSEKSQIQVSFIITVLPVECFPLYMQWHGLRYNVKRGCVCKMVSSPVFIFFIDQESVETISRPSGANPRVFMDIQIGNKQAGKIIIELRADVVPKTAGKHLQVSS